MIVKLLMARVLTRAAQAREGAEGESTLRQWYHEDVHALAFMIASYHATVASLVRAGERDRFIPETLSFALYNARLLLETAGDILPGETREESGNDV